MYAKLCLEGRFEIDALIAHEISLDEVNGGYDALKDPGVHHVVITRF